MIRKSFALATLLAVTACGSEPETPAPDAPVDRVEAEDAEALAQAVDETLANRVPTRFQGVWDYVGGTCARESDMRMEISGSEILFYESIGTVTDVAQEGEDVLLTLAMEGEGETWRQVTRLSLTGEGAEAQLATSDGERPKVTDEYPRKRCPA